MSSIKIGVTLDYCNDNQYAKYPYYALRENYIDCFVQSGADVVPLHYSSCNFEELDGIVVTGGNFDIDPKHYNQAISTDTIILNEKRTEFEFKLTQYALLKNIPFFGICGGMQLLNVVQKGTLIQDILDTNASSYDHSQKTLKHLPSHKIEIIDGTKLHNISGKSFQEVNSTHHQAIAQVGESLIVCAVAEDGIIEAIELDSQVAFALGVQWHPEYMTTEFDRNLIKSFINACQKK